MKLTLGQLVASTSAAPGKLSALALVAGNEDIPAFPASYWIGKVLKKADSEMTDYYATRDKICEAVGAERTENQFNFNAEQILAFNEQIKPVHETQIEFKGIEPIRLSSLGSAKIPPAVMSTLDWLFQE